MFSALVWQLMRAYTLSILQSLAATGHPIVEKEIVDWANRKVSPVVVMEMLNICADNRKNSSFFLYVCYVVRYVQNVGGISFTFSTTKTLFNVIYAYNL